MQILGQERFMTAFPEGEAQKPLCCQWGLPGGLGNGGEQIEKRAMKGGNGREEYRQIDQAKCPYIADIWPQKVGKNSEASI